ncbi:MAG: oligosaccharide flippase family protein, partial [Muribaculaceae bacterium]|nr:oligosaccharide flippase family protein [Muribaculaceae bacterium]
MPDINRQIKSATKWSTVTEIAAKLVAPVSTMVLARVLTPAAFGILVTATMVISFAEIFTDAGFQKYLIQHEFKSDADLNRSTNVAFWSNLSLSVILLGIIISFSSQIADIVGSKGNGFVISVSCLCIPLAAFSSIQMALFRRKFDFKTLFIVRMIGNSIPIVITIQLALILRCYWAI